MQSFAVLDGWPGPFQTAESSGRIQKDEPIPQLRWEQWNVAIDGGDMNYYLFFLLRKWIKSKNIKKMSFLVIFWVMSWLTCKTSRPEF